MTTFPFLQFQNNTISLSNPDSVTPEDIRSFALALADLIIRNEEHSIVISCDTIPAHKIIKTQTISALNSKGIDVVDIGNAMKLLVEFATYQTKAKCYLHIHEDKGQSKLNLAINQIPLDEKSFLQWQKSATSQEPKTLLRDSSHTLLNIRKEYIQWLAQNAKTSSTKRFLINTETPEEEMFLQEVLDAVGIPANIICGASVEDIQQAVVHQQLDVAIHLKNSMSSIEVWDNQSNTLSPDALLSFFAQHILPSRKGGTVLYDMKSSQIVYHVVKENKGKGQLCCVDLNDVQAKIKKNFALLAGSQKGSYFFGDTFYATEDGIYAIIRLLGMLEQRDQKLSEMLSDLPTYYSESERYAEFASAKEMLSAYAKIRDEFYFEPSVKTFDGIRLLYDWGWALVRPNPENNHLEIQVEAAKESLLEKLYDLVIRSVSKHYSGEIKLK